MQSRASGLLLVGATLLLTIATIVFGSMWLDQVELLQSSPISTIPDPDIRGDYLAGVRWAGVLTFFVVVWGSVVRCRLPLLAAWLTKLLVALGPPMLLYDYIYGVDPDGYFGHAASLGFEWQGFQLGLGTQNIRTLAWLSFRWVTSSFNASRLNFALIGLFGVYLVYRAGVMLIGREDRRIFFAIAFMPSVVFWSTILGKDPITMFGVAAYTYGVVAWHVKRQGRYVIWIVAGTVVAMFVRLWFAPILLIPLVVLGVWGAHGFVRRAVLVALGVTGIVAGPLVLERAIGVDLSQEGELLSATDTLSRSFPTGGSSQEVPDLATPGQLAAFAPFGMFSSLFRPLPGEVRNAFGTLTGIENALLLLLAFRAAARSRVGDLKDPLVAWAISLLLIWSAVYSVAAFQNLGTLSRYRFQITPLFVGTLLYLGRRRSMVPQHSQIPLFQSGRSLLLRRGI